MELPRILAIDNIRFWSPSAVAGELCGFYREFLGLESVKQGGSRQVLEFRGWPRSGPKLVVTVSDDPREAPPRRQAVIQVASLISCMEWLDERNMSFEFLQGWFPYDRRLYTHDPAGNRIDLVAYHTF